MFYMGNTKAAGSATEAVVMAEFLKAGSPLLMPFGENSRYDLVVEAAGTRGGSRVPATGSYSCAVTALTSV